MNTVPLNEMVVLDLLDSEIKDFRILELVNPFNAGSHGNDIAHGKSEFFTHRRLEAYRHKAGITPKTVDPIWLMMSQNKLLLTEIMVPLMPHLFPLSMTFRVHSWPDFCRQADAALPEDVTDIVLKAPCSSQGKGVYFYSREELREVAVSEEFVHRRPRGERRRASIMNRHFRNTVCYHGQVVVQERLLARPVEIKGEKYRPTIRIFAHVDARDPQRTEGRIICAYYKVPNEPIPDDKEAVLGWQHLKSNVYGKIGGAEISPTDLKRLRVWFANVFLPSYFSFMTETSLPNDPLGASQKPG